MNCYASLYTQCMCCMYVQCTCIYIYIMYYPRYLYTGQLQSVQKRVDKMEETQNKILEALSCLQRMIASKDTPRAIHQEFGEPLPSAPPFQDFPALAPFTMSSDYSTLPPADTLPGADNNSFVVSTSPAVALTTPVDLSSHQDPLPLQHTYASAPLPSSEVDKGDLVSVKFVLESGKTKSCKPSTLAQMVAKEAIFGAKVMRRCTPSGTKDFPALPKAEMYELKKIFQEFPQFWHSPQMFEVEWKTKCWAAIEQACGSLRRKYGH